MSTTPKTLTLPVSTSRANPTPQPMKRLTVPRIRQRKGGEPLVMLTAYTVRMAQLMDPHCDMLLVGDSLGMVVQGHKTTLPVTVEDIAYHTACVARGAQRPLLVADGPPRPTHFPRRQWTRQVTVTLADSEGAAA